MSWENFDHDIEMVETWWQEGFANTAIAGLVRCVAHLGDVARSKGTPSQPPAPETGLPMPDAQHRPVSNGIIQQSENLGRFDEDLVEWLSVVARKGRLDAYPHTPGTRVAWEDMEEPGRVMERAGVRAVLAELAKMPCELPSAKEILAFVCVQRGDEPRAIKASERLHAYMVRWTGPSIAAKNARIDELQRMLTGARGDADAARDELARVVKERDELAEANRDLNATAKQSVARIDELETQRTDLATTLIIRGAALHNMQQTAQHLGDKLNTALGRIADIESRTPANSCDDAERKQYEPTIERQRAKTFDLFTALDSEHNRADQATERIAELEQRNAALAVLSEQFRKAKDAADLQPGDDLHTLIERWRNSATSIRNTLDRKSIPSTDGERGIGIVERVQMLAERESRHVEEKLALEKRLAETESALAECAQLANHGMVHDEPSEVVDAVRERLDRQYAADKAECLRELRARQWPGSMKARILEGLQSIGADGKTPGEVASAAYEDCPGSRTESWEAAAAAVLRFFGNGVDTLRVSAEVAKLEGKPAPNADHVHELGSCSFCDRRPPNDYSVP